MTKQAAVQRAYQWATHAANNPKSGCVIGLCARQVMSAVESNERYEEAYAALEALLADWRGKRLDSLERVIKIVTPMLVLEREQVG